MSKRLVWLVTGCSSGLGSALVKEVIRRGDKIVATARNSDRIRHLEDEYGKDSVRVMELDISKSLKEIKNTVENATNVFGGIDVKVSNAALPYFGPLEDASEEDMRLLMDTNFYGPMHVTKAILPHFRQRRKGTLFFIGSRLSSVPLPWLGPYAASKAAQGHMAEILAKEVKPFGVRVHTFDPSALNTDQYGKAPAGKWETPEIADYQQMANDWIEKTRRRWSRAPGNVSKIASLIADFARLEGCAAGDRPLPTRLQLGYEVRAQMLERIEEQRRILEEWKDVIEGTDDFSPFEQHGQSHH